MGGVVDRNRRNGADRETALGIVVSCGSSELFRPPVTAFVWGRKVEKHPSIPYGRWKEGQPS